MTFWRRGFRRIISILCLWMFFWMDFILYTIYLMTVQINDTCIGCWICGMTSSTIFEVKWIPATVLKQPETPEETIAVGHAIENCPVKAISND